MQNTNIPICANHKNEAAWSFSLHHLRFSVPDLEVSLFVA